MVAADHPPRADHQPGRGHPAVEFGDRGHALAITSLFRFVQFEFPGVLGPSDGRHPLRERDDQDPAWIVALETIGAARPRGLPGLAGRYRGGGASGRPPSVRLRRTGRSRPVDPGEPAPVSVSRATVIDARPLPGIEQAEGWLDKVDPAAAAARALGVLNRLIAAHRIAAADPYARELSREAAVAVRVGFGQGQALSDGGWSRAVEVAPPSAGRLRRSRAALRPEERLAALLAGRDRPLACEELALRARLDLDLERPLAAALGTRLALEAALVELGADARASGLEERLAELRELRDDVIAASNSTLVGSIGAAQRQTVTHTLGRIEATIRARPSLRPPR